MPFLAVEQLTKTYSTATGPLTVLKDASFSLEQGQSLAIVGPSGSGKTTLLGLCAGLDEPSHGSVSIDGQSFAGLTEDQRAAFRNQHIGFVFQNFQLIPTLTALENVLVPLELRGANPPDNLASDWLARTGLGDRLNHYPIQLSGGEQQRVALARAFIHNPKLLFCDEPTGNLDGDTAHAMVELIFTLHREQGSTLVLVTHDLDLAHRCDHLLRLKNGQIVAREVKP